MKKLHGAIGALILFAIFFVAQETTPRVSSSVIERTAVTIENSSEDSVTTMETIEEPVSVKYVEKSTSPSSARSHEINSQASHERAAEKTDASTSASLDSETKKSSGPITKPVRLIIPSIGLDADIEHLGLNSKGEMDVPSGTSDNVGWYKHGTLPGNTGSAVIDAHVFAAFKNLKNIKNNADVYVVTSSGQKLHFKVASQAIYTLAELPGITDSVFNRSDTQRLNLITCSGNLTADRSTYDHRLVVYTKFVGIA